MKSINAVCLSGFFLLSRSLFISAQTIITAPPTTPSTTAACGSGGTKCRLNALETEVASLRSLVNQQVAAAAAVHSEAGVAVLGWDFRGPRRGPELINKYITFQKPFTSPPNVLTSLTVGDHNKNTNLHFFLEVEELTETGFRLKMRAGGAQSHWYMAKVSWLAVAA